MRRIYVHPLPVRIWHWINAVGFVAMIITGLQIRYVGQFDLMPFWIAVDLHNLIGFVLIGNFLLWFSFYLFTDKIKVYHPELSPMKQFRASFRQLAYYGYGIFKGDPNPHHVSAYKKFNAVQSMSYQIVMLLLFPIQLFTGILLWDVQRFSGMVELLGGVRVVDTLHVLTFIVFTAFIFIHPYLTTLGHTPTAHIKAMFTGYEEIEHETPMTGGAEPQHPETERRSGIA
ncbi:MAG: cytochrome b/b6 domain-containing protein [Gammaproteobacteria bacterium]|nr:cytochrome b/b6 domain-containing protein [Gammaproteobacteria bacterium]